MSIFLGDPALGRVAGHRGHSWGRLAEGEQPRLRLASGLGVRTLWLRRGGAELCSVGSGQGNLAAQSRRHSGRGGMDQEQGGDSSASTGTRLWRWANRPGRTLQIWWGRLRRKIPAASVSAAVEAVISFSSPTDLTALYSESPQAGKAAAQFLGGSPSAVPAKYAAASPVDQVAAGDPPVFLVHGQDDPLVPVTQSEELAAALTSAGVRNQLVIIPGGPHNLDFPNGTPRDLVFQILAFLDATWKDKGSQSLTP